MMMKMLRWWCQRRFRVFPPGYVDRAAGNWTTAVNSDDEQLDVAPPIGN
jgi:hypothetical protein